MKMKRDFFFLFYLIAGIITGSIIANLCVGSGALGWLAYGQTIGFSPNSPAVVDLAIFTLTFGFSMSLTVAHIITISIAMFIYRHNR